MTAEPRLLRPAFGAPGGIGAVSTTREGFGTSTGPWARANLGSECGDDAACVAANRDELLAALVGVRRIAWLRQVHGTAVHRVDATAPGAPPEADAAIAATPGVAVAVLSADCLPVLVAARDGCEVAAIHAGWRGLAAGVIEATFAAMTTPAPDVVAWIGPAIGYAAYEVGAEVRERLLAGDPGAHATCFSATRPGHWRCDLAALARRRLDALGVGAVVSSGLCTASDPARFYSHRRDSVCGRMASLIWIAA